MIHTNLQDVAVVVVMSPPSQSSSTLLSVSLSCGGFNDLCNHVSEHGDGGPGLIDHCDKISSSSTVELSSSAVVELTLVININAYLARAMARTRARASLA